jgi:hypothetical protein
MTHVAQDHAQVGVQAETIHGDVYTYHLSPDAPPEERFRLGVRYLDARMPNQARERIEEAVARGYETDEVRFHRLLALLSGRTLRQLGSDDFNSLSAIFGGITRLDGEGEWTAGVRSILRMLNAQTVSETDLAVKELDRLTPRLRNKILDHLGVLLNGHLEDQMWRRSVDRARAGQYAAEREDRIWKFFHPTPAQPRVRPIQLACIPAGVLVRAVAGATAFLFAFGHLGWLLLQRGEPFPILGYLASIGGVAAFMAGGTDWHFRRQRLRTKEAELKPKQQRSAEAPAGGFARKVDRLCDRYFSRYVPRNTDRSYWLEQTAGIRRQLRDELVEIYREQRIPADRIAYLVRYLVGDVKQRWENNTLTAHRDLLRLPLRTVTLCLAGASVVTVASLWTVPAAVLTSPVSGTASVLLAIVSSAIARRACFHITSERRRVTTDQAEQDQQLRDRWAAFNRWQRRLANKPSDMEMASWLECDRKILVDDAMRHYHLKPSQVIAHAFIEAPAASYKRARVSGGPWRYSRYHLLLFLLTDDGVRQVNIELDFEAGTARKTQRLNYRYDAVAAVRIDGLAAQRQTFELTLVNGGPIQVPVTESGTGGAQPNEDPRTLSQITLDASGLIHTLNVMEGIAAEGKEWIKNQRRRADHRLADLAAHLEDLIG